MIKKGSFVRYTGEDTKDVWKGKYLSVADREGDKAEVYKRDAHGKWITFTVNVNDLEEVC